VKYGSSSADRNPSKEVLHDRNGAGGGGTGLCPRPHPPRQLDTHGGSTPIAWVPGSSSRASPPRRPREDGLTPTLQTFPYPILPTLQTLQEPILRTPWVGSRASGFPNPSIRGTLEGGLRTARAEAAEAAAVAAAGAVAGTVAAGCGGRCEIFPLTGFNSKATCFGD
jgi:hypothetical protein